MTEARFLREGDSLRIPMFTRVCGRRRLSCRRSRIISISTADSLLCDALSSGIEFRSAMLPSLAIVYVRRPPLTSEGEDIARKDNPQWYVAIVSSRNHGQGSSHTHGQWHERNRKQLFSGSSFHNVYHS